MFIDQLNLNHLRIFECVYRHRSMTLAARELHLTQSGVSQHMAALEESLGMKLFDRIRRQVVPTAAAAQLYKRCSDSLSGIEETLAALRGESSVAGNVSIGMPVEFGNNVILPMLAELCKEHRALQLDLRLGFANQMNEQILAGNLDFAFVDQFGLDKRLEHKRVYDETLHLCATPAYIRKKGTPREKKEYFEALDYVDYQAGEPVVRSWLAHHLGIRNFNLNTRAIGMDAQGVARLIQSDLAAGVLPDHLVSKLENQGSRLHQFKGSSRKLKNTISIAYLGERSQSAAANLVMHWLLEKLATVE
ncbi:MAG: LysR family transcriptional regulator [Bdellovibrionota bacterium]